MRSMNLQPRFITKERQEPLTAYWGKMTTLGTLGEMVSVFRVAFHDGVPHKLHHHPRHDEIVTVTAGEIDQTIGEHTQRLKAGESAVIPRGMAHKAVPKVVGTVVVVVLFGEGTQYETVEFEGPVSDRPALSNPG
jgi:quercetin dioxygenase-like cupin family protein